MGFFDRLKAAFSSEKQAPSAADIPAAEEVPIEESVPEEVTSVAEEIPVVDAKVEETGCGCATPGAPELTEKEKGRVYKVSMNYHAGYDQYREWPNGGKTIHSGVGWFHPFGPSEYYGMADIGEGAGEESKQFPLDQHFSDFWMREFETDLFCIYRLKDGDIYAYDGIFCQRGTGDEGVPDNSLECRRDILTNVIVGGTGRYEGIRGLMMGTAEGSGDSKLMDEEMGMTLPRCLLKCLEGYVKIPTN